MKAYHLNNTLTSFIMNPLVETGNFLASKQASKQASLVYNPIRYFQKPGRGAVSSLAGLLLFLYLLLCPMVAWGQQENWINKANTAWYDNAESDATEFTISTAEDLAGLAQLVNGGNDFSGKTIKLDVDIDLNDTDGWENWDDDTNAPEYSWTPIGSYYCYFSGTFDGQGHTISGIYISTSDLFQGLFGVVRESGRIQNLTVAESYICGEQGFIGGIVGWNYGTVSNCTNSGTVKSDCYSVGGIVGENDGTVSNCLNSGMVKSSSYLGTDYTGGIVGWNDGTVSNCLNSGMLISSNGSDDDYTGGIVGYNYGGTVSNCLNSGEVTGGDCVGGIVGRNDFGPVSKCTNSGEVIGGVYVGGIVGYYITGTVSDCYYLQGTCEKGIGAGLEGKNVEAKGEAEYKNGEVAYLLQDGQEEQFWGQVIGTNDYPVLIGNLSEKDQAAYKVYSATFTYTLPNAQEATTVIKYGNSGTSLTAPEVAADGYTFNWDQEIPKTFGAEDIVINGLFKKTPTASDFVFTAPDPDWTYNKSAFDLSNLVKVAEGVTEMGTFTISSWQGTNKVDPINAGTYTVKVSVVGDGSYAAATDLTSDDWTFVIEKANPAYTKPENLSATYGETLKDVTLPEGWAWKDNTLSVGKVGDNTFTAIFTPDDTENYNVVENIDLTVTVGKANPTYTIPTGLSAIYGETLKDVTLPDGWSWENEALSVGDAGKLPTFKATFTPDDTKNYNVVENIDLTVTVGKANPTPAETPSSYTATVGDRLSSIQLPDGWAWEDDPSTILDEEDSYVFVAIFTPDDTDNYNSIRQVVTITVVWPEPEPEPEPEPIYYRVDLRPVEGATVILSADEVEEGGTLTFTIEIAEGYVADDLLVTVSQGIGKAVEVKPDETGVYTVENVDGLVTITVYGVTEAPTTGIAGVQGVQVYAREGAILVHTPTEAQVVVVSMGGSVVASGKQTGLRRYALPRGFYVVWVDGVSFKVAN